MFKRAQACGTCLQVSFVAEQHRTMIEAVENHMPETVIVVSTVLAKSLQSAAETHHCAAARPLYLLVGSMHPSCESGGLACNVADTMDLA